MSERGSFVTEYIYCDKCFEEAKKVLLGDTKTICSQTIASWDDAAPTDWDASTELPIIAGKIGGGYRGEEFVFFENVLIPVLEKRICHTLRVAILAESGEGIYKVEPEDKE